MKQFSGWSDSSIAIVEFQIERLVLSGIRKTDKKTIMFLVTHVAWMTRPRLLFWPYVVQGKQRSTQSLIIKNP